MFFKEKQKWLSVLADWLGLLKLRLNIDYASKTGIALDMYTKQSSNEGHKDQLWSRAEAAWSNLTLAYSRQSEICNQINKIKEEYKNFDPDFEKAYLLLTQQMIRSVDLQFNLDQQVWLKAKELRLTLRHEEMGNQNEL